MSKDEIKQLAAHMQSPYADSKEAMIIMGIGDADDLKSLVDNGVLRRYPRKGNRYVYLKSECLKCAENIDKGAVKIPSKTS